MVHHSTAGILTEDYRPDTQYLHVFETHEAGSVRRESEKSGKGGGSWFRPDLGEIICKPSNVKREAHVVAHAF